MEPELLNEYIPPLTTEEILQANQPTYADGTPVPITGTLKPAANWLERVRDMAKETALSLSGYYAADAGGRAIGQGIAEGSPQKVIGGAGMMGTAVLPYAGGIASKLFSTIPRAMGTGAGMGMAPQLAQGVFGADEANAQEDPLTGLFQQRSMLEQQRQNALENMSKEERSGRGPRYRAAKKLYDDFSSSLNALDQQIQHLQNQTSPEAKLKIEQQRQAGEDERAQRLAEQNAGRPFRERHPMLSQALPVISSSIAAGLGAKAGLGQSRIFNKTADDISSRWGRAVKSASDPKNILKAEQSAQAAQGFARQMDRLEKPGLRAGIPSPEAMGAGVVNDAAFLGPSLYDKYTTAPGSEAYQEAEQALNPEGIGRRLAGGIALGAASYKVGKGIANHKKKPTRYDAETEALSSVTKARDGAAGYYGRKMKKASPVERQARLRAQRLKAQRQGYQAQPRSSAKSNPKRKQTKAPSPHETKSVPSPAPTRARVAQARARVAAKPSLDQKKPSLKKTQGTSKSLMKNKVMMKRKLANSNKKGSFFPSKFDPKSRKDVAKALNSGASDKELIRLGVDTKLIQQLRIEIK